ncbi:hypothetical protein R3P38DRAFT_2813255 [Favolaschia claudopus]|uniref:Uncharacterized protein n=1 Tax=Favolaschia claudopus TaxID=2862362 RepID=A0AAV9Z5M5_9AGAR
MKSSKVWRSLREGVCGGFATVFLAALNPINCGMISQRNVNPLKVDNAHTQLINSIGKVCKSDTKAPAEAFSTKCTSHPQLLQRCSGVLQNQESKRRNSRKVEAEVQKVQGRRPFSRNWEYPAQHTIQRGKEREINAFDRNSRQRRLRRAYCIGGGASIGGGINIGGGVTVLAEVDIGGGASVGGGVWAEVSDIEL